MLRLLIILAAIVLLGAGLAFLADSPAQIIILLPGWRISLSAAAAAAGAALFAAAAALFVSLIRLLLAPLAWRGAWRARRQAYARQNLTDALLAGFGGDSRAARQKQSLSAAALPAEKEPLAALAQAQISAAEAEEAAFFAADAGAEGAAAAARATSAPPAEGAQQSGASAAANPHLRLLMLKTLYVRARAEQREKEAGAYAAAAARLCPACLWASFAAAEARARAGDWQAARGFYENFARARARRIKQDRARVMQKSLTRRLQTALCGQASALFARRPHEARAVALEAHKMNPHFPPAAALAAEILFRLDETRKAEKLLLAAWRRAPQADLARVYISAGETVQNAAKQWARAQQLAEQSGADAAIAAAAEAACRAGDCAAAQSWAEKAAAQAEPERPVFILLAELAARRGALAAANRFLARALAAPPQKAWCADGKALPAWQPLSPESRKLGACRWQTPPHAGGDSPALARLLRILPAADFAAAEGEKRRGRRESARAGAETAAPLHGFAPPARQAETAPAQSPAHLNVDNPGVEGAQAEETAEAAAAKQAQAGKEGR